MKLHIVPARQGILWVKLGMRTFFRQPLAQRDGQVEDVPPRVGFDTVLPDEPPFEDEHA